MATTCGVIRWKCARPRFEVCWPKLALACASTSIWKATARPSSRMPASSVEGIVSKRKDFRLPFRPLARLAQNEEPDCTSGEALRRRTPIIGDRYPLGHLGCAMPRARHASIRGEARGGTKRDCKIGYTVEPAGAALVGGHVMEAFDLHSPAGAGRDQLPPSIARSP
jgi:hypothetical protein